MSDEFVTAVLVALGLLGVYLFLTAMQPVICPHPVYAQGVSKTLSCDGTVPVIETKR